MTRQWIRNTIAAALALTVTAVTLAGDAVEIRLKDGSRWKGELTDLVELTCMQQGVRMQLTGRLVKAAEYYITVETNIAGETRDKTIFKSDIMRIKTVRGDAVAGMDLGSARPANRTSSATPAQVATTDGPGLFVLPLRGMVGLNFRHEEIEAIAAEADKYGDGQIIVLLIDSGGGAVTEMEKIHETLNELKKRHRIVAWIKQAISAACATAMHCHEIYFMTEGTAGAMTAFNGATGEAWSGDELKLWLERAGDWMEQGGRSRYIAEAMIHNPKLLSYDKDPVTGDVTFYNDLSGEFVLSREGQNLVFTASNALHCGFSDGTADTEEELAKLLDLDGWHETSTYGRELSEDWNKTVETAQREIRLLANRLEYAGTGGGDQIEILGKRKQIFEEFLRWRKRLGPNTAAMVGIPPEEMLEREISEIRKDISDLKKRRR